MKKLLMIIMALIFAASFANFAASVNAVTSGLAWQDGSKEITINDGDSLKFQVDVGSFNRPLTIDLFLMNDNHEFIYERDLVVNDYIFGDLYLVTKEHYEKSGDYKIYLEVKDGRNDFQIQTLDLHVLASNTDVVNNLPVVTDIIINENKGLFSFEVVASDADRDEIKDYESRVVSKGVEYSAFCEGNVCTFNSRDPTNDGFEFIESDDNAVVKARAYDGKNWGNWYEEKFVIDNKDIVAEGEDHEPVLDLIGNREVFENTELRFTVTTKDEDNDVFAVNAENLPSGASFKNSVFAWKPGYEVVGHGGIINGILKFISFGMLGNEPSSDFEVTFTVIDSKGNYDLEKIKIKVNDINRLPTLDAFNVNVNEGDLVKVKTFTSDPDNDKVKVTFSSPLNNNGEWQTGFADSGIYVVTVTADDSYNGVVTKNINVNVADVNRAPLIDNIEGAREVFEGDLVKFRVNAHDDDFDALLYSVDSNLFSKFANDFRWQTNIGDAGTYSLNFAVDDGKNGKDSENLVLIVKEKINLAPAAEILKPKNDLTIFTGDSLEFVGRGEDSDGTIEEYKWLINGEEVSNEDKFTFTFNKESNHKVEFLVKDNRDKWSDPDSVNVKVEKKIIILNNAPVIDDVAGAKEVFAGDVVELTVKAHDVDSDDLTYSITGNKFSQSGNKFIWRTSDSDVGNHFFIVTVNDGKLSDYKTVNIHVKEKPIVNNAPKLVLKVNGVVVSNLEEINVKEDEIVRFDLSSSTDSDGDVLKYGWNFYRPDQTPVPENLIGIFIDINQIFEFTPSDKTGSYNVKFIIEDRRGGKDKIVVRINFIKGIENQAPVVGDIPNQEVFIGDLFIYQVVATDEDKDVLTYSLTEKPLGMNIDSNGKISWRADKAGSYNIIVGVSDSKILASERFTLLVKEKPRVNQAPVVGDIPDQTITSGQAFNDINLDTFVIDLDNSDKDISWVISGASRLTVSIDSNRIARISYPAGFVGSETITFTAKDPSGAAGSDVALFTVQAPIIPTPTNNNPVLNIKKAGSIISKVIINEGENLILNLEGSDIDNDTLRFSAMNMPAGAVLTSNVFSWTPSNVQGGKDYFVVFRVFDLASNGRLKGGSDLKIVTITVNDNLEPVTIAEKAKVKRHALNIKNMIINNWETVKKEELFDFNVVVENKGNVRENNVRIILQIPQLDIYERSNNFDIKKNKAETRGFSVLVPEDISDEVIYAIVTVSSDKDEVSEVIGFLVEQ